MSPKRKLTEVQRRKLLDKLAAFFATHNEEFLKCKDVSPERRLSNRADLHVFMMLDRLVPGSQDIISDVGYQELVLDVEPAELMRVASEEDLLDMIRCGLRYDSNHMALCMFV